jgi:hypothetical protein
MMSDTLQAVIERYGLTAGAVGEPERLQLPEPQVDEARTARPRVSAPRLRVRSDVLASAGITAAFDEATRELLLGAAPDLAFTVESDTGEPSGPPRTAATIDAGEPSTFVLGTDAGPLAVGAIDDTAIELHVIHAWPRPPLDAWVSGLDASDRDLVDQFARPPASRWAKTVDAGRIARLTRSRASEAVALQARRWPRRLTEPQRMLIERFAVVCARDIGVKLQRFHETFAPDDRSLEVTWTWFCWERDDLEGIRVLLREAGGTGPAGGDALAAALQALDAAGRAVRASWPPDVDVHDDRLQRVSEADPGAWWGSTRCEVAWL